MGGGRIGSALKDMGPGNDVIKKRDDPMPTVPASGPIYVTTRNNDLQAIIDGCPPDRREDLVFMQNGMLGAFLEKNELADATQVLLYLAVAKFGEKPTDGITELNPDGLTAATGKWASTFATRLRNGGLKCRDLAPGAFERLAAYGRVVAHFPTAVKEFEWRNGWFYAITEAAVKDGKADPCPLHTAGLKELGVVKE